MTANSIVTLNRRGRTSDVPNEYGQAFIAYAERCRRPVLDLGTGLGVAAVPAVLAGATVIANDIDPRHLRAVEDAVPPTRRRHLRLCLGAFPGGLRLPPASLDAVHASNLLNFLRGTEIEEGLGHVHDWLVPDGRLFLVCGTPYARNVRGFIPTYEARRRAGARWPGEVEDLQSWSSDPTVAELPPFLHLLDDAVLERTLRASGFVVEDVRMYRRSGLPSYLALDGRENVGVIARRAR